MRPTAPIRDSVRGRTEFPKRTMSAGRRIFRPPFPSSFTRLSACLPLPLPSPFFCSRPKPPQCFPNPRWRLINTRWNIQHSLAQNTPALRTSSISNVRLSVISLLRFDASTVKPHKLYNQARIVFETDT